MNIGKEYFYFVLNRESLLNWTDKIDDTLKIEGYIFVILSHFYYPSFFDGGIYVFYNLFGLHNFRGIF